MAIKMSSTTPVFRICLFSLASYAPCPESSALGVLPDALAGLHAISRTSLRIGPEDYVRSAGKRPTPAPQPTPIAKKASFTAMDASGQKMTEPVWRVCA
jgi:hypothetical protein